MSDVQCILKDLVSFSVLGGESNLSIANYIKKYLENLGVAYQVVPNEEGTKESIHCRIGPSVDGGVILSGHTDVVPVEGQEWSTRPFELIEKDEKLYARGAADMKGFVACCLAALPDMLNADLKKPIYFAFSYDEEIGCLAAPALAAAIHDFYHEKPKFAIIGEPSLLTPTVGQKGICIFETTVNGSAGHSSRIRSEVSAIHEAARLVLWLEARMDALIKEGHTDDRFTPNHTSLHVGTIQGGIAPNVIADRCSFHWDVRTIPQDNPDLILEEFEAFCQEREEEVRKVFPSFTIETKKHHPTVPGLDTPEDAEVVALIRKISGNNQLQTVAYAAEAGQFAEAGFQAVICGPGDIAQAHRADEFIAVEQLEKGMEMLQNLIKELSK